MAQIVTITNPLTGQPVQVDQLDHTAQEIDDAIARAISGGAIDIALQNKAPAGYGLGTYGRPLGANDDLNNITKNGWYCWFSNLPANAITSWSAMFVNVINDGHIVQTIYPFSMPGTRIIRVCTGSIWKPDEYENPPMKLGEEYRTTERFNGKPVYAKAVNVSVLPSAGSYVAPDHNIANFGYCVECCGSLDNGTSIPYVNINRESQILLGVNSYGIRIYSDIDISARTAVVKIKYTKTTD